jgi:hypothetical protein
MLIKYIQKIMFGKLIKTFRKVKKAISSFTEELGSNELSRMSGVASILYVGIAPILLIAISFVLCVLI